MKILLCALVLTFALMTAVSAQQTILYEDWQAGQPTWSTTAVVGQWFWLTGAAGNATVSHAPEVVNDAVTNLLEEGNLALKTYATTVTSLSGQAVFNLSAVASKNWKLEWDFFGASPALDNGQREFGSAYGYTTPGGASLVNAVQWGVYNTMQPSAGHANEYDFRVVNGNAWQSGSSPQQTLASGWGWSNVDKTAPFDTDGVTPLASNWHHMAIEGSFVAGASYQTIKLYIDGANPVTWKTTSSYGISQIRMGSGLGNNNYSAYYDNISLTVPEPGSVLALGTGLIGLLGFIRRRRA